MGQKGVSKRKPKAQKLKPQVAATTSAASEVISSAKETDARATRTVARGQAITSGKGGKEKYSESRTNKKK